MPRTSFPVLRSATLLSAVAMAAALAKGALADEFFYDCAIDTKASFFSQATSIGAPTGRNGSKEAGTRARRTMSIGVSVAARMPRRRSWLKLRDGSLLDKNVFVQSSISRFPSLLDKRSDQIRRRAVLSTIPRGFQNDFEFWHQTCG